MTDQIKAQQGDRAARKVIIAIPGSPPFGDAFQYALNMGAHQFWWRGKRYHTLCAGETDQDTRRPAMFDIEAARERSYDFHYIAD